MGRNFYGYFLRYVPDAVPFDNLDLKTETIYDRYLCHDDGTLTGSYWSCSR